MLSDTVISQLFVVGVILQIINYNIIDVIVT